MKTTLLTASFFSSILCLMSCSADMADRTAMAVSPEDSLFQVNSDGFQFDLLLPKELMQNYTPELFFNEAFGLYEVRLGPGFHFTVSEENAAMGAIKKTLNEDMLFKNHIVEETPTSILFQRILPDGMASFYQYIRLHDIREKNYQVRTLADGQFNKEEVERMKHTMDSMQ